MEDMKFDMSGAAAVLGTFETLGLLKPKVNVVGLIPATENLPSGHAVKPGDVVKSHFGKTIEIINTDAEGRLILCDALSYVRRFKPAAVIDIATLTGAVVVALGQVAIGAMGNDEALLAEVREAGERAGERCWPLPLWDEYRDLLKSDIADVRTRAGAVRGRSPAGGSCENSSRGIRGCTSTSRAPRTPTARGRIRPRVRRRSASGSSPSSFSGARGRDPRPRERRRVAARRGRSSRSGRQHGAPRHRPARLHDPPGHDGPRYDRPRHPAALPPRIPRSDPHRAAAARHALYVQRRLARALERPDAVGSACPYPGRVRRARRHLRRRGDRVLRGARCGRARDLLGRRAVPAARARLGVPRPRPHLARAARAHRRDRAAGLAPRLPRHAAPALHRNRVAGRGRHGRGEDGELPRRPRPATRFRWSA